MKGLFSIEPFIAAALIVPLFSAGQESREEAGQEAEATLEEVQSVGDRFTQQDLNRPVNSTFLTSDDIADTGSNSIPELLLKTTTVRLINYTGNPDDGQLAMRGFGDNSQLRVAVIVDGVRYNRVDMNTIPWLQIPTDNIESVEVLRGANSARYGNNAIAGVINIKTRDITKEDMLAVSGMYGSYDTYSVSGFGSLSRDEGFATVNARRYYTDGYREYSKSWSNNFGGSVGYFINDATTFTLSGNYSKIYTQYPNALSYDQMMQDPQQATWASTIYDCSAYVISGNFDLDGARTKGYANFSYNSYDRQISNSRSTARPVEDDQYTLTFASEFETEVAQDLRVYAGFEAQYTNLDRKAQASQKISSLITADYLKEHSDIDRLTFGAHAGATYDITEKLSADICGRADACNTKAVYIERGARTIFTPPYYEIFVDEAKSYDESVWQVGFAATASLNYKIDENSSAYIKFDQIFRYPSTDEIALYQSWGTISNIKFNKDLKPETGQNIEIGYKYLGKRLNINASLYALFLHDEIMYFPRATPGGDTVNDNVPDTMRLGADLYASYNFGIFGIYSGASLVDARFIAGEYDGCEIPMVPWFNCFAGIFVNPTDFVTITVQTNYASTQYQSSDLDNELMKMPDYVTLDIRLNIRINEYASAFFAVDNVLDEKYALAAVYNSFYPAIGRMFKAGINLKF